MHRGFVICARVFIDNSISVNGWGNKQITLMRGICMGRIKSTHGAEYLCGVSIFGNYLIRGCSFDDGRWMYTWGSFTMHIWRKILEMREFVR